MKYNIIKNILLIINDNNICIVILIKKNDRINRIEFNQLLNNSD